MGWFCCLRDGTGFELLQTLLQRDVKVPFMLMSTSGDRHLVNEVKNWGASFCYKIVIRPIMIYLKGSEHWYDKDFRYRIPKAAVLYPCFD